MIGGDWVRITWLENYIFYIFLLYSNNFLCHDLLRSIQFGVNHDRTIPFLSIELSAITNVSDS